MWARMLLSSEAERLRRQAQTCRNLAGGMSVARGRDAMTVMAAEYDWRADVLESHPASRFNPPAVSAHS